MNTPPINRFVERRQIWAARNRAAATEAVAPRFGTNRIEQLLVMAPVILMPLEAGIPQIGGFGVMYLVFAAQAAYVLSKRLDCLMRVWNHPLLLSSYGFVVIAYIIESSHVNSDYYEIFRMAQNFGGAALIACLCRDRKSLLFAMYGYLIVGTLTSYVLFRTSYTALSTASAVDYGEGDVLRAQVFDENPLGWNLNGLAFVAAQGVGIGLALALTIRSGWFRYVSLGVAGICLLGVFLPMSRTGVVILLGICATVAFAYGVHRSRTVAMAIIFLAVTLLFVPQAVFSRLVFSTEVDEFGRMEGRALVYTAFFHHLPEVAISGVGRGGFWGDWGKQSQYGNERGKVSGAHNIFFQMTIYWGVVALLGLFVIIYQAYLCLPGRYGDDGLAIGLLCVAVSLLLWSLTVHNLYDKSFALGIGLLVGAQRWIWSTPINRLRPGSPVRPFRRF